MAWYTKYDQSWARNPQGPRPPWLQTLLKELSVLCKDGDERQAAAVRVNAFVRRHKRRKLTTTMAIQFEIMRRTQPRTDE